MERESFTPVAMKTTIIISVWDPEQTLAKE